MFKPSSRVAVAVLIALIVIVGVFASVQAASASSGSVKGRVDATAGDSYYSSQQRGFSSKLSPYGADNFTGGHDCQSERGISPNDY